MLTRIVRLTFVPDREGDFLEIFKASEALIRGFDGCRGVRLMHDMDADNVFFTISEWESAAHLERYRQSEVFRSTWSRTKLLFSAPPLAHSTSDTGH